MATLDTSQSSWWVGFASDPISVSGPTLVAIGPAVLLWIGRCRCRQNSDNGTCWCWSADKDVRKAVLPLAFAFIKS